MRWVKHLAYCRYSVFAYFPSYLPCPPLISTIFTHLGHAEAKCGKEMVLQVWMVLPTAWFGLFPRWVWSFLIRVLEPHTWIPHSASRGVNHGSWGAFLLKVSHGWGCDTWHSSPGAGAESWNIFFLFVPWWYNPFPGLWELHRKGKSVSLA